MPPGEEPVKVLHVLGNYPLPPLGGIETVVVHLSEELSALGIESRVVAASRAVHHDRRDSIEFIGVRAGFVSNWIQVPYPSAWSTLREQIRWAEVVHVHNPPELFNLVALMIARDVHRPAVLSLLSPGGLVSHPRLLFRWAGIGGEWVLREATGRAAAVQVKNTLDYEYLKRRGTNPQLIPDGVEQEILAAPHRTPASARPLSVDRSYPTILFLGRLQSMKGPEDLVDAIPLLVDRFPGIHAVLAGPDADGAMERLRERARRLGVENRVVVAGAVDGPTKLDLLDACHVVAIPSQADFVEGFSIVASEAWARLKPVAAYPVGALKARVKNGENGYLAGSVSVPGLAEAIAKALTIERITIPPDVVGWDVIARRFRELYDRVLAGQVRSSNVGE